MSPTNTVSYGRQAFSSLSSLVKFYGSPKSTSHANPSYTLPRTTPERLATSSEKTILYLAYGSNLSAETFKGTRGINPLSAVNAHVPSLSLTFDLAGIPYQEPCFANTKYRHPNNDPSDKDYHKDRWHKGLIGVVYEVTLEDYRTIIATEGGGASYEDVVVPCYALAQGGTIVDPKPSGVPFEAHTLLMPTDEDKGNDGNTMDHIHRPDPSYAQPSARYLKLIRDGGEEHGLPSEYLAFLYNIRPYTITTMRQRAGQATLLATWLPIIMLLIGLGKVVADESGKIPDWLATAISVVVNLIWSTYDGFYKKIFGDGERTIYDEDEDDGEIRMRVWDKEKIEV